MCTRVGSRGFMNCTFKSVFYTGWSIASIAMYFPIVKAEVQSNLLQELKQAAPGDVSQEVSAPQISKALNLSFNRDDQIGLVDLSGINACKPETLSPAKTNFNWTNFGKTCYSKFEGEYFQNFDMNFRRGQSAQPVKFSQNINSKAVFKSGFSRFVSRSVNKIASQNDVLRPLVEGKLSIDFNLGELFSSKETKNFDSVKPKYVLQITDHQADKLSPRVASNSDIPLNSLKIPSYSAADFRPGMRNIIEEWPAQNTESPAVLQENESVSRRMARSLGIKSVPFSRFGLRVERRIDLGEDLAIKFVEGSELVFVELGRVMKKSSESWSWGAKLPYGRHSLNVLYSKLLPKPRTSYSFVLNDDNRADVSYNANDLSCAAGFTVQM